MSEVKVHLVIPHRDHARLASTGYLWCPEFGLHPNTLCRRMGLTIDNGKSFRAITFSETLVDYLAHLVACKVIAPENAIITVFDDKFVARDLTIDEEGLIHGWPPGYLSASY